MGELLGGGKGYVGSPLKLLGQAPIYYILLYIIKYLLTGVALGAWSVTPLNGLFSVVKRALNTEIDIKYVLD